jgi:hypothetical protein
VIPTGKRSSVSRTVGFIIPLLFLAAGSHASVVRAQSRGTFTATGNMTTPRAWHTATLLADGKVLIAGGEFATALIWNPESPLASAELYDSSTGTFSPIGDMTTPRRLHTATLLADGRVLIAGGYGGSGSLSSAELYDPSTRTFTATGNMLAARVAPMTSLLRDGKVLITGDGLAELYDPSTGTFAATGAYACTERCEVGPATLLPDGKVLFAGYPAQLYDPVSGTFSLTGTIILPESPTATLLTNGKVLFAGGVEASRSSSAELYDPASGRFASTGNMAWRRVGHTAILQPDGTALIAGGESESCTSNFCIFSGSAASAELYEPSLGAFTQTGDMTTPRELHTATVLNDGRVLIAGGLSYGGIGIFFGSLASAELYEPAVLVPGPVLFSLSGDGRGQGAILHAGTHQVVSPSDPAIAGEALEIYGTGLLDGSVIPPQVAIGGRLADILYFGKAPGFAGLNQVNVRVPGGAAPGADVPVRLTYLGRPSNEVTIGVQ